MNPTISRHLQSALVTFIASFFTLLGAEVATLGTEQLTKTLIVSLLFAAIRGAFKIAYEAFAGSNDLPTA